jgi:hypothetical protein
MLVAGGEARAAPCARPRALRLLHALSIGGSDAAHTKEEAMMENHYAQSSARDFGRRHPDPFHRYCRIARCRLAD